MRVIFRLVVAAALLALTATPSAAAPAPKLDVGAALAALGHQQVYVAPGSVAKIDMAAVRNVLTPDTKLLVTPYEQGYKDDDQYIDEVYDPVSKWTDAHHVHLILVEGIEPSLVTEGVSAGPSTLSDLREQTAYLDVTGPILALIAYLKDHNADVPYPKYQLLTPTADQADALATELRANAVYNAPGREDPVKITPDLMAKARALLGRDLRIAALPILNAGEPFVDYAPALAKRFPGSVVMVAQGRWLEIAGPDRQVLSSARDFAYGRFEEGSFTKGSMMSDRVGTIVARVGELRQTKPFGRAQPPPQPIPHPYDVRRTISDATPWALLGSAVVLTGSGFLFRRLRTSRLDAAEKPALRRESARAVAAIRDLGAKILGTEESGRTVNPAAAERHDTARTLYDQALTAKAMTEVAKIADEGLAMSIEADER